MTAILKWEKYTMYSYQTIFIMFMINKIIYKMVQMVPTISIIRPMKT